MTEIFEFSAVDKLPPVHPGEILQEYLESFDVSAHKFAVLIDVPPDTVTAILNGTQGISPEMAQRFSGYFGTSAQFWVNLQANYERKVATLL